MKISNETKVGALTAIAITVLILGFNFLKGKDLSTGSTTLYTEFPNVKGLLVSNPVMINGLQVGKVTALREKDKNMSGIIVTLSITRNINIPVNSVATMSSELLGTTAVDIHLGQGNELVKNGDTLRSTRSLGLADKLEDKLDPTITGLNKTLTTLDEVLQKFNTILDPNTRGNLQEIIANLARSTKSLEQFLDPKAGKLVRTLDNIEVITGTFAKNSGKIDSTFTNLQTTSEKIAKADLEGAITSLKKNMEQLEQVLAKMQTKDGTLGALLNDRQLYDEIRKTNRSLNILLDDFRVNPKRYVNISVFGKKDKKGPLMAPVNDSIPK
jgi:ABC-type transport system involved in resistance to organic solvents, periplasmic component